MTRLIRFRFSLATLLIATAWSAVMVWANVTPRSCVVTVEPLVWGEPILQPERLEHPPMMFAHWGWPWDYAIGFWVPGCVPYVRSYAALAADAGVGVLLVVVLTCGSNQLLRRVGARLRRRKAVEEQP